MHMYMHMHMHMYMCMYMCMYMYMCMWIARAAAAVAKAAARSGFSGMRRAGTNQRPMGRGWAPTREARGSGGVGASPR